MPVVSKSAGSSASSARSSGAAPRPAASQARPSGGGVAGRGGAVHGAKKIVNKELGPFTRQISSMMTSGMSLVASLSALHDQAESPAFRVVLGELLATIEGGAPFSDALSRYPQVFDSLYINMVRAGERSGEFAPTLKRLAMMLESSAKLKRKVKGAMTYPVVVMTMALTIAFGIITFVVPVFAGMYADFGGKLPLPTQVLLNISNGIRDYIAYIIPSAVVALFLFRRWAKTSKGEWAIHARLLKMPVIGLLTQKVAVARFTRLLAQMLRSGVPILEALELVAKATGNRVIEHAILEARRSVEQGGTITSGLQDKACLPKLMIRMVEAGEKSGRLDEMLDNIADTYDDEVETMLAALTSLMEPLLMVFLGVVIGGIVVALFMPLFKMGELVSAH
ncbi:MAG: type II secretion system F family protein [bacterium]